jgi:hypothetical protein
MSTFLLACLPLLALSSDAPKVRWETDLAAARQRAKKLDRPLFVVFRCDH